MFEWLEWASIALSEWREWAPIALFSYLSYAVILWFGLRTEAEIYSQYDKVQRTHGRYGSEALAISWVSLLFFRGFLVVSFLISIPTVWFLRRMKWASPKPTTYFPSFF